MSTLGRWIAAVTRISQVRYRLGHTQGLTRSNSTLWRRTADIQSPLSTCRYPPIQVGLPIRYLASRSRCLLGVRCPVRPLAAVSLTREPQMMNEVTGFEKEQWE